jgi:low affinity Fe/Cu permease
MYNIYMNKLFNTFADKVSIITGRSYAFAVALSLIVLWALSGPFLEFSDTWQLIINTLTTLITFLMVFIIQNSQNKSNSSTQIKLDLIMRVLGVSEKYTRNIENLTDKELEELLEDVRKRRYSAK